MEAASHTHERYCPHCQLLVEAARGDRWPGEPMRCPHCHLLIGVGRGLTSPSSEPGTKGTAAGIFSREAKRVDSEPGASAEEVLAGIRQAAKEVGERPERLLMVDYQQLSAADPALPDLSDVFAAYGSWKRARRLAAE